jgi:hypothetical protein
MLVILTILIKQLCPERVEINIAPKKVQPRLQSLPKSNTLFTTIKSIYTNLDNRVD